MKTRWPLSLFIIFLLFVVGGVFRLRFETDLTSVLPDKVAQVESVKSFHQYFNDDQQLVILLRYPDDRVYPDDAADLAETLEEAFPACQVIHSLDAQNEVDGYAAEIANIWALSSPDVIDTLSQELQDTSQVREDLLALKERIKLSFSSGKAIQNSYDPLGLMNHPGLEELAKTDYSFESNDGKSRFLFLKKPSHTSKGYQDDAAWVSAVRAEIDVWIADYDEGFTYGLTGGPVYNAEVGAGMQQDMLGTVIITLVLIAVLFLALQRSMRQLLLLIGLVLVTFLFTLGIAGWVLTSLNMLSVAFAAILLGLIIDYAVVILREAKHLPRDRHAIRKGLLKSISLAALSTSIVFSILIMSSFPGVRELGILVVIGLLCGAVIMLYGVPLYIERYEEADVLSLTRQARLGYRVLITPALLLLSGLIIFLTLGTPSFQFSLDSIQPKSSTANLVQKELSREFASWSDLRTVVFSKADSPQALEAQLSEAYTQSQDLLAEGLLTSTYLPAQLIPYASSYETNRLKLQEIATYWDRLYLTALDTGYTDEAMKFDRKVFDALLELPQKYQEFCALPRPQSITKSMIAEHEGTLYFRGNVVLAEPLTSAHLEQMQALNNNGVTMTGWSTLSASLEPVVRSDFKTVFLPAAILILIALGFVFRSWIDASLVLFVLLTSLVCVNAMMVLTGMEWNFLNGIALPLIIGVGIDYSIHLIFALKRHGQEFRSIWRGVGLAITFCGLSSMIGFGSLAFANNDLLRSLGIICAFGVLATMFLTLLVIPPVWRRIRQKYSDA